MLKRHREFYQSILLLIDFALISVGWVSAYFIRFYTDLIPVTKGVPVLTTYLALFPAVLIAWGIAFKAFNLYRPQRVASLLSEVCWTTVTADCSRQWRSTPRIIRAFRSLLLRRGTLPIVRGTPPYSTRHASGTLRAGLEPRSSVVDAQGKVHGIDNLYVADGSVLPRLDRAGPALTIYAWGLRLGALLGQKNG